MLTTVYFAILFLESDVSHMPVLSAGPWSLALLPVVWLGISVLALVAMLLRPSAVTSRLLQVAMIVAAAIGVIGVFPHLSADGIGWNKLGAFFTGAAFHAEPGPQWPLAITIGAVLGFIGASGIAENAEFMPVSVGWPTKIAFLLLVIGILLSYALTTLGWGSTAIVAGAVLLLVLTFADIVSGSGVT